MAAPGRRHGLSRLPRPGVGVPGTAHPSATTRGFLFADLRGFTRYVEEHGNAAGAALLERYRTLVRAEVATSDGAEIRTEGDSFYVVFATASAATRCALAIVEAASRVGGLPIEVGVGIHAGEAVETPAGPVGSAVNIAARLCETAGPGEVVVSETVRALSRGSLEATFEPLGSRHLKGVDEPVTAFAVHPAVQGDGHAAAVRRPAPARRWRPGAAGAAALLMFGAVGAFLWQGGSWSAGPTPPPSGSAGVTAAPTAPPATDPDPGWTAAEAALLARVPLEFQRYCRASNVEDGAAGGIASLRCNLRDAPGYGADTVWYDAFDEATRGEMAVVMTGLASREGLPAVQGGRAGVTSACERSGKAVGRWELGSSLSGQLACYMRDREAWLAWTYEGQDVLVRAVRLDGNVGRLVEWWDDRAADYLR